MSKISNLIEYKDQFLTLNHYKEPLKSIPKTEGYGYYGCVLSTLDGEKIQCHICGELYEILSAHIYMVHKMKVHEYREKFDLARTTALISERMRQLKKEQTMAWLNSLSEEEKLEMKRKAIIGTQAYRERFGSLSHARPIRLETKNKRGTCPDQLVAKIQQVAKELGHTPSKTEFIHHTETQRYVHLIYKTFGSWTKAVERAGLETKKQAQNGGPRGYTKEELIEFLQIFYQEEGKIPTETDCRRGLIPNSDVYKSHFGSLPKARELAGIDEVPTRWGSR